MHTHRNLAPLCLQASLDGAQSCCHGECFAFLQLTLDPAGIGSFPAGNVILSNDDALNSSVLLVLCPDASPLDWGPVDLTIQVFDSFAVHSLRPLEFAGSQLAAPSYTRMARSTLQAACLRSSCSAAALLHTPIPVGICRFPVGRAVFFITSMMVCSTLVTFHLLNLCCLVLVEKGSMATPALQADHPHS